MQIRKIFNIVNSKNEVIGKIDLEKYDDMEIYTVNTNSVGISFKTLVDAIQYIEKFNYRTSWDKVTAEGYSFKDVKINIMQELGDHEENFQTIYNLLLDYTTNKGFLENHNSQYLEITGIFNKTLEILNAELEKQIVMTDKANRKYFSDDLNFDLEDLSYKLNESYFNNLPAICIIDNSITGILIKLI
jgi:hypothetical protein